jgi:RimJ/RimL family protein N-acetyltransferase
LHVGIINRVTEHPEGGQPERVVILTTPRLILTTWLATDVDPLLEMHSDPESMRYVRFGRPETRTEVEDLVGAYIAAQTARGWTKWRLADLDGDLVGRAGFGGDDSTRGIAYAIRRSHWGLGLATEIAGALVGWHMNHAPAVRLRGLVVTGNDPSARVLQKTGFVEVGTEDFHGTVCRSFIHPLAESVRQGTGTNQRPSARDL